MKKDFKVIILGSDENAYGNARLIYEAYGQKSLLMCSRLLNPSKYSHILQVNVVKDFDKEEIFVKILLSKINELKKAYEKIVVLPCADYYVDLMVNNYENFEGLIANKFIPQNLLNTFYKKDRFYSLCEKHGLDYPKTYIATKEQRMEAIDNLDFAFPIVVKPDNSNSVEYLHSQFEGKKKVYFFKSREEYLSLVTQMNTSSFNGKLIIQEFIEGGDDAGRVINSYSNNHGKVMLSCIGQPILEEYAPGMLGNYAAIISRYDKDLYDKIKSFLESINYIGFSNIDMKYDKKTSRYLAFELNPRPGRSSFFVRATGVNMIKTFIEDVVFNRHEDTLFVDNTALWLNIPKKTIAKYVKDEALKNEALSLYCNKKFIYTLKNYEDSNLSRWFMLKKYYELQHSYFNRFYFEKNNLSNQ